MHDHRARRPEPRVQMRYPGNGVRFNNGRATGLDQMLSHVAFKIGQQLDLLFERPREILSRHVCLLIVLVDKVDVAKYREHEKQ